MNDLRKALTLCGFWVDGGITVPQLAALNARQADIEQFLDVLGGGVVALTEGHPAAGGGSHNPYAWLHFPIGFQDLLSTFDACPTEDLALIPGHTADCGNQSGFHYHNRFGDQIPPSTGVVVLALSPGGDPLMVGRVDFVSEFDCNDNGEIDDCECPTDVDGNGDTGPFDLAVLLGCWGSLPGIPQCNCLMDADGDGNIGPFDLAVLLGAWGPCCGNGTCDTGEGCGEPNECVQDCGSCS